MIFLHKALKKKNLLVLIFTLMSHIVLAQPPFLDGTYNNSHRFVSSDFNSDHYGDAVASYSSWSLVGNTLFRLNAGNWNKVTDLLPSGNIVGTNYGSAVAMYGNTIAVAAPNQSINGLSNAGEVYIFRSSSGNPNVWSHTQTLSMPTPQEGYQFGYDLALDGNYLVIGMKYNGSGSTPNGKAFIFEKPSTSWVYKESLAPNGLTRDNFGEAVDVEGNRIVVGAPAYDTPEINTGTGFIFQRNYNTTNWDQVYQTSLPATESKYGDHFGLDVAIYSNMAVFGAKTKKIDGQESVGVVYIFKPTSGVWSLEKRFMAPDGGAGDRFGENIVIQNNLIAVGVPHDSELGNSNGSVYIFEEFTGGSGNWGFVRKLRPSDGEDDGEFGASLALTENGTLLVGSPGHANDEAFVYEESASLEPTLPIVQNNGFQSITDTSLSLKGKTVDNGDISISDAGVVWSATNTVPTIQEDNVSSAGSISAGASFSSTINNLNPNSFYYLRTYATNQEGTTYGAVIQQSTVSPPTRLHYESSVSEVTKNGDNYELNSISHALTTHPTNNFVYAVAYLSIPLNNNIIVYEQVGNTLNVREVIDGMSAIGEDFGNIENLTVSPDGKYLYVVSNSLDQLIVFDISADGTLTVNQQLVHNGTDASGSTITGLNAPQNAVVSQDGAFVYIISEYGQSSSISEISVFSVNSATGKLDFLQTSNLEDDAGVGIANGKMIKMSPDESQLVASAGNEEIPGSALIVYDRNMTTGLLSRKFTYTGTDLINIDFVFSKNGAFIYGINSVNDHVLAFKRDSDGSLTAIQTLGRFSGGVNRKGLRYPRAIEIGVDGQLYISSGNDDAIGVFDTDAITGSLSYYEGKSDVITTINGSNEDVMLGVDAMAVDPTGNYMITGSALSHNIFSIDQVAQVTPEILLSNAEIDEEQGENITVGKLSLNIAANTSFSFASGASDTDNNLFEISAADSLILKDNADFEVKEQYEIRVSAELSNGVIVEQPFTIQVNNINEAPTSISFSTTEINDGFTGGVLGELSAEDPDMLDDINYYFISGDNDNDDFIIDGNQVKAKSGFALSGRENIVLAIEAVDTYGDGLSVADTFTIDVIYVLDCEVSIVSSADILCDSNSSVTLDAGAGFVSYNWSTGETTRAITIAEAGNYAVEAINADGCVANDTIAVTILEEGLLDLGEDIVQCDTTEVTLSAGGNFSSYEWSTGDMTQEIAVDSSGEYSVNVTTTEGCVLSDTIQVTMESTPKAQLSSYGFILTASEGASFQWYLDGELLADSTQSIVARKMGVYEVAIMTDSGCESFSDELTVLVTGNEKPVMATAKIYPNPVKNSLHVKVPKEYNGKIDVSVYSSIGELVTRRSKTSASFKIEVRDWPSGIYMILLKSNEVEETFKVIKK